MTISRKKLLNGLGDHELFKQRDWKLVALSAEEILEARLDGSDMTAQVVKSDRPMPSVLTRKEREVFGLSMQRVKNVKGHIRFLQRMESFERHAQYVERVGYGGGTALDIKRSEIESRLEKRLNALCFYGLHYHQSRFHLDTVDLKKMEVRVKLHGYLAHPKFKLKRADCMVTIPITPSAQIVPKIKWADHPNPRALEKKLFSKRDWELGAFGKITKHEGMPSLLTRKELAHSWIAMRRAETSKRGRYIASLQSLDTPQGLRLSTYRDWVWRKAENGMKALCGYMLGHRGWEMNVAPADLSLMKEGDDCRWASITVRSQVIVAALDSRGKLESVKLVDKEAKDR